MSEDAQPRDIERLSQKEAEDLATLEDEELPPESPPNDPVPEKETHA